MVSEVDLSCPVGGLAMTGVSTRAAQRAILLAFGLGAGSWAATAAGPKPAKSGKPEPLRVVAEVPMPGPAVRFDYQSLDATSGRLHIAHMNADQLVVFDVRSRQVVANLDGFARVHGVWAVPELGRVYASATGNKQVNVVDMKSLNTLARVGPMTYPDGLAYAPEPQRIFVSDEHGKADVVIDAKANTLLATIPLGGDVGNTVYEPISRKILVAVHEP